LSQELVALSNDLSGLTFDVQLQPGGKSISGEVSLAFKNKNSWVAQRMFDHASKAGPPPPIFWSAPRQSDAVFFDRGADGKNYAGIKRHGANLVDAALARQGFPAGSRKGVVDLFERLFDGSPVSVSASGHVDPGTPSANASEFDRIRTAVSASLGWQLVGFEEGPKRVGGWLRDFAKVYRQPAIQRWIRKETALDVRSMPKVRYGVHAATGLPGLKALRVTVPATAFDRSIKGRPKPFTYYVMVFPQGSRTWVAMGADKDVLEKQLRAVKAGGSSSIEGKAGLESLKSQQIVSGGYMTIAGLASQASGGLIQMLDGGPPMRGGEFQAVLNALARIPNHGETPMVVISQVHEGSPARVAIQFRVNEGTIADVRSLVMHLGGGTRMPAPPPPRHRP